MTKDSWLAKVEEMPIAASMVEVFKLLGDEDKMAEWQGYLLACHEWRAGDEVPERPEGFVRS